MNKDFLYSQTRIDELPEAFQTRNLNPGCRLFRFFPPQRADVLETEKIRFSSPLSFNDPFDIAPIFVPPPLQQTKQRIRENLRKQKYNFGGSRRIRKETLRKLEKQLLTRLKVEGGQMIASAQDELRTICNSGILCLTAKYDNLLMWAHYAQAHAGFVVEFATNTPAFRSLGMLRRVIYSQTRPRFDLTRQIIDYDYQFRKGLEWEYEQEFRIFRPFGLCQNAAQSSGQEINFAPFPRNCIKAVFLGCRSDDALMRRIRKAMVSTGVCLWKAQPSRIDFVLEFVTLGVL